MTRRRFPTGVGLLPEAYKAVSEILRHDVDAAAGRAEQEAEDHDAMMAWATVLYSADPRTMGPQDLKRNRVEVAEALVGQWIEAGRPRVRP